MVSVREGFAPFIQCMRAEGLPDSVIRTFEHYYAQLAEGETGLIPETAIVPIDALPDAEEFPPQLAEAGEAALSKTVLLKLNGGLGTSMGLDKAKSLLEVKNGLSFLDIIARQALHSGFPLVLMNSFSTRDDSLARLEQYPGLQGAVPLDFLQHKVPKITAADLTPVSWAADPLLEWCPPGHGDLYTALVTSGMLDTLLEADFEYAFVSNSDNLGAVLEPTILGFFAEKGFPFLMEVADRTPADKKGGHLARLPEGQLVLRESAQCPDGDLGAFQDIDRHRYFNTNNLWLHLPALKRLMVSRENVLSLPMICNRKTVDPRDGSSTPVYQLETAMGAAIAVFSGAGAIRVPRSRFAPVKTTGDLLAVRSDIYVVTDDFRITPNPARQLGQVVVNLDSKYYKMIQHLESRFPHGTPSLLECERLSVEGDVTFGRNVTVKGVVHLANQTDQPLVIEDDAVISELGKTKLS